MRFKGHELVDELRAMQADKIAELVRRFVKDYPNACQPRRKQELHRLIPGDGAWIASSINRSIAEPSIKEVGNIALQLTNYPCVLLSLLGGFRYVLKIYKNGSVTQDAPSQPDAAGRTTKTSESELAKD